MIPYCNCKDFLLLLIFYGKTDLAAQTVRPRLRAETWSDRSSPHRYSDTKARHHRPNGGATEQKNNIAEIFGRSSYTINRRFKNFTQGSWVSTDFSLRRTVFPQQKPTFAN